MGLPPELERMVAHEDQEMGPHQEETELVDLGIGSGKREVKIGTGITAPIREENLSLGPTIEFKSHKGLHYACCVNV